LNEEQKAMSIKSENGLYQVLETVLREQERPMDCNELFGFSEVKAHAASPARVSDYLAGLWRKGLVSRLPSAGPSKARWAYQWKKRATPEPLTAVVHVPKLIVERPHLVISEEGKTIQIEMSNLTILIKAR